jgi:hypothetical protein
MHGATNSDPNEEVSMVFCCLENQIMGSRLQNIIKFQCVIIMLLDFLHGQHQQSMIP